MKGSPFTHTGNPCVDLEGGGKVGRGKWGQALGRMGALVWCFKSRDTSILLTNSSYGWYNLTTLVTISGYLDFKYIRNTLRCFSFETSSQAMKTL